MAYYIPASAVRCPHVLRHTCSVTAIQCEVGDPCDDVAAKHSPLVGDVVLWSIYC